MILSNEIFFVTFLFPAFFKTHRKCGVHETVEEEDMREREEEGEERRKEKGFGSMDFFVPSIDSFLINKET